MCSSPPPCFEILERVDVMDEVHLRLNDLRYVKPGIAKLHRNIITLHQIVPLVIGHAAGSL